MTAYDPQARRARPSPSDESPVDGLLESVPVVDAVPDDVAEAGRVGLPLVAGLDDLVMTAADEVPPHHDLVRERFAPE